MYMPLGYLKDFLRFLDSNRERIEVLTYADLPWHDDWDYEMHYPREAAAWKESLCNGTRDPRKIYLLLQHDVDSKPERTMEVLKLEEQFGLRSNVMIFRESFDRKTLQTSGHFRVASNRLDYGALRYFQEKGFVIGYHCNAYERAEFDRDRAESLMSSDVQELRRHLSISFMSAHGGPPGPDGNSNDRLRLPSSLRTNMRWVHNGHSISEIVQYTDGGFGAAEGEARRFDLTAFIRRLVPGKRYRLILHPQYYGSRVKPRGQVKGRWYQEVLKAYAAPLPRDMWIGVTVRPPGSTDARFGVVRMRRAASRGLTRIRRALGA
jgi:hypothetical protein